MDKHNKKPIALYSYFSGLGETKSPIPPIHYIENETHLPFKIERVFWTRALASFFRGFHGHRECRQVMFAINGRIEINLTGIDLDGKTRLWECKAFVEAGGPGLLIEPYTYLTYKSAEPFRYSEIIVFASTKYDENDYFQIPKNEEN